MPRLFRHPALALLLSIPAAAHAEPDINERTPCSVAVKFMDAVSASNTDDNMDKLQTVLTFMKNTMEDMDSRHTESGEPGIVQQLSDDGFKRLLLASVEHCREHPKMTIYNSTGFVYRGTRELELAMGVAR